MAIQIPGHKSVKFYPSDSIPGEGPVEISDAPAASSGGPDYAVVTEATAGDFYVMVDATNYLVAQV